MAYKQTNISKKHTVEIEMDEEALRNFEKLSKSMKEEIPNDDRLSCFINASLTELMIKDKEPIYRFFNDIEKLCEILTILPQLEKIKFDNFQQMIINPDEQIIKIKQKIENIWAEVFCEIKCQELKSGQLSSHDLSDEIKIFIFLRIITNIEVFLEDRLKKTLEYDKELFKKFVENLDEDMPRRWRNGVNITPSDYFSKMEKIIFENLLLFPYHDISGRTKHMYIKAFGLDLLEYPRKNELLKLIKKRHLIIHRGHDDLPKEIRFSSDELGDYIKLSYEFILWIENKLAPFSLRDAFDAHYQKSEAATHIPH